MSTLSMIVRFYVDRHGPDEGAIYIIKVPVLKSLVLDSLVTSQQPSNYQDLGLPPKWSGCLAFGETTRLNAVVAIVLRGR